MGQSSSPQWWEIVVGILAIPAAVIGLFYSFVLFRKTLLEARKTRLEIIEKEKKLFGKKVVLDEPQRKSREISVLDSVIAFLLLPLMLNSYRKAKAISLFQIIFGVLIEFLFFCAFLYATICLFNNYFSTLYPVSKLPPIFDDILLPFMISSGGLTFYLGILLSDILGMSNIFGREFEKRHLYLFAVIATAVLHVIISVMVAISRFPFPIPDSQLLTEVGFNLMVIPLLMGVVLSFRGILFIDVLLVLVVYIVKILVNGIGALFTNPKA